MLGKNTNIYICTPLPGIPAGIWRDQNSPKGTPGGPEVEANTG